MIYSRLSDFHQTFLLLLPRLSCVDLAIDSEQICQLVHLELTLANMEVDRLHGIEGLLCGLLQLAYHILSLEVVQYLFHLLSCHHSLGLLSVLCNLLLEFDIE